ncbi:MAG: hypothetical protein NTV62_02605, partial [Candidatus Gribaldobacteria bacterium]|nr:hypothetical protein [Candidatus Gribaldobacteria bacterium]
MIALILFGFGLVTKADFNSQINYQGKLTNASGGNVSDGGKCMNFAMYDAETSGSLLWSEEWVASTSYATSSSGIFSVLLGEHQSLSAVDFNQVIFLEVQFDPGCDGVYEEVFSPRKKLGAVPASLEAKKLSGKTEAQFGTLAENEVITGVWNFSNTLTATATNITVGNTTTALTVIQNGSGKLVDFKDGTTSTFVILDGGNVGIATSSPLAKLDVFG